jgi:uncharacterized protein
MKLTFKRTFVSILLTLSLAAPVVAGPGKDAMDAIERGDYATALRLLRQLAEQCDAQAQYNLGVLYDNGQGVPQNDSEAMKWYRKAADQGECRAQVNLGTMYSNGQGVPQNYAEAMKWFRKAADQGFAPSQYTLGLFYRQGTGVPQNNAEAVKWYRKAADQGYRDAQFNLASMYASGLGVPQDYVQAHMWRNLAAMAGDQEAGKYRDIVAGRMTATQIAEAQKLARDWKPTLALPPLCFTESFPARAVPPPQECGR